MFRRLYPKNHHTLEKRNDAVFLGKEKPKGYILYSSFYMDIDVKRKKSQYKLTLYLMGSIKRLQSQRDVV